MSEGDVAERPLRRVKSETRQKTEQLSQRYTEPEIDELTRAADAAGISVSGYIRESALHRATSRTQRRPRIDQELAAKFLHALNRVGANIYQILRALRFNDPVTEAELQDAAKACRSAADACHAVIEGRSP